MTAAAMPKSSFFCKQESCHVEGKLLAIVISAFQQAVGTVVCRSGLAQVLAKAFLAV